MSRNIKTRRKLNSLYKRGVEVRFSEDGGRVGPFSKADGTPLPCGEHEVAIWVAAPSPIQREMAMREAQAKRARTLLRTKRDDTSEEFMTAKAFLADMSLETLIDYVLSVQLDDIRNESIRDVLSREEWEDMTELQEAMRQYDEAENKEDPEWMDLIRRDIEYGRQVAERQKELLEAQREVFRILSRDHLEARALERRAEIVGSQTFMFEYEKWMTYYSVRDIDDHDELFFDTVEEWNQQEDEIRAKVAEALQQFIQDGTDAKNSPRADRGSQESGLPSKPETSDPSILVDAKE